LEGPDGSGTTRHSEMLAKRLRLNGYEVLVTAEPTVNPIGKTIRKLLREETSISPETLQLLFCADRSEHINKIIQPAINEGKIVISDRYSLSTIVYGAVQGIGVKWLESINDYFIKPDITFIALPPFSVGMERIRKRHENDYFEKESFQEKVYEEYAKHASKSAIIIDTSDKKQHVAQSIINHILRVFSDIHLPITLDDCEI
jgi:dTMP kinase